MSTIIDWTAYLATAAWAVFALWYALRARWWEQPEGRNVMGVAVAITALLLLVSLARVAPDWAGRPIAQLAVYGGLIALAIQRTVQLERAQRRHPRRHKHDAT